jgi:hypothetical protein
MDKPMAGKRGKSGRKPKGEFSKLTSSLTIRIPDDMRRRLGLAANRNGCSLTQELLWRLEKSFEQDLKFSSSDPPARALTFLFEENLSWVFEACELLDLEGDKQRADDWHLDRFIFRTFRIAVCRLLEALEPKGEIRPLFNRKKLAEFAEPELKKYPPEDADLARVSLASWKSPETRAEYIANSIWSSLHRTIPTKYENEADEMWRSLGVKKASYGMSDVRRDLKLMSRGKRT